MKKWLRSSLALLLVLCTLLSLCGILSACKKDPVDDGEGDVNPDQTVQQTCAHAVTTLKNVRKTSCAQEGYTGDTVCVACGATVKAGEAIPALPHTMDMGLQTKAPTCMELGVKTYTCYECGLMNKETLSTVGHSDAYHDALDSHTHQHTCSTCTMSSYEVHIPKDAGVYHAPTCTEPAYTEHTCAECGGVYKEWSTTDLATGHAWPKAADTQKEVWVIVDATCCATGSKTRECLTCGETESMTIPVATNAHNYVEYDRQNATCVSAGTIYLECSNGDCHRNITETIAINPNAHKLETTEAGGWSVQSCQHECGYEVKTYTAPAGETQASVDTTQIADDRTFEMKTEQASIQFPTEVISQIKEGNQNSEVSINAGVADNKSEIISAATNLSPEQKARLESEDVDIFNFSVSGVEGDFATGVTVTIPYELGDNEDPNGIKVWFVATDGTIKSYDATYVDGYVTFVAEHFSYYAVAYEETQEAKCRRGVHDWMETDEDDVVAPTCTTYGYTVEECSCCHTIQFDDLKEKTGHDYGDYIFPTVTCTEGGYVTQVCENEGCGHTLNYTYQRPLGHQLTGAATCTTDATCSRCNGVITPATGHEWSDWQIVFEPTATQHGLRRKNCPKCGLIEDVKLAATGSIQPVTFESYEDVMESMMETVFAFHNGEITFTFEMPDEGICTMHLTVNEEGESYVMLVDATVKTFGTISSVNGTSERYEATDTVQFLYRNGVTVLLYEEKDHPYYDDSETFQASTDLETLFMMPYHVALSYAKQGFDLYMPEVEASFDEIASMLRIMDALCGDSVNATLDAMGAGCNLTSLAELYDKVEKVYLFTALTLGFSTTKDLGVDVEVPTTHDFMEVLAAFSTVTTDTDGNKTYVLDANKMRTTLEAILTWLDQNQTRTMASLMWEAAGAEVKTYYPDVTDFTGFMAKMRSSFTGTMTVKAAIDQAISMLESKNICTLQELYGIMDAYMTMMGREGVKTEDMVKEYYDQTLDAMVQEMDFENVAQLFDAMEQSLNSQTLTDMVVDYRYEYNEVNGMHQEIRTPITFAEWLADLRAELARGVFSADISFTFDAHGKILGADINQELIYTGTDGKTVKLDGLTMQIKRDDTVKVQIPANFAPVSDVKIEAIFDENGDMLITVPEGFEYSFTAGGHGRVPMAELVDLDEDLTAEMGYPVYVLKQKYWNERDDVARYILYNGKYYEYTEGYEGIPYHEEVANELSLATLLADPAKAILPAEDAEPKANAYFENAAVEVFETLFGPVFQLDGVWQIAKKYNYSWRSHYENNVWVEECICEVGEYVAVADAFASVQISNINNYYHYDDVYKDDTKLHLMQIYISLDPTAWGRETVECLFYIAEDGSLVLCDTKGVSGTGYYYHQLGNEVPEASWPEHDEVNKDKYSYTREVRDAAGNVISGSVEYVTLYVKMPAYYVKVGNSLYARLASHYGMLGHVFLPDGISNTVDVSGKNTMMLPDGNTMYIFGEKMNSGNTNKGRYDRVVYGYVKANSTLYIQAVCRYNGNSLLDVVYHGEYMGDSVSATRSMAFDEYIDMSAYLTKVDDTTYRISAAYFTKMQGLCTEGGDSFWVSVNGSKTVNGEEYSFVGSAGIYEKERLLSKNRYGYDTSVDWYNYFGNQYYGQTVFTVTPGEKKDTVTVELPSGKNISLRYEVQDNNYPADGLLPIDQVESAASGLQIYSAITSYYSSTYLYENGKYYSYSTHSIVDPTYASLDALKARIATDWEISDMYYRYDFTEQDTENRLPIYETRIYFRLAQHYSDGMTLYLTIKDGKLYVLAGAVEEGDSVLRFEEMVLISTYFANAAQNVMFDYYNDYGDYDQYMINGNLVTRGYARFYFSDLTEDGEEIKHYFELPYVKINDEVKYLESYEHLGIHLEKKNEVTSVRVESQRFYTSSFNNADFTFATVTTANREYFVKLAGAYYDYNQRDFYNWQTANQDSFENGMASFYDHYYGVYDEATETWSYYNKLDFKWDEKTDSQYAVLSEPLTTLPTFTSEPHEYEQSCKTAEGLTVTEFSGYVMGDVSAIKRADGTVFYRKGTSHNGYLKIAEDLYVRAKMIVDSETGSTRIVCTNLSRATISNTALNRLNPFSKYVTVDKLGNSLTISKDILEAIPEEVRDGFEFCFYVDYQESEYGGGSWNSCLTVTYDYLVGWFGLTEPGQCYSGYFNGFNANTDQGGDNMGGGNIFYPGMGGGSVILPGVGGVIDKVEIGNKG